MIEVLNIFKKNTETINNILEKLIKLNDLTNLKKTKSLKLISSISTNIPYLRDEVEELYLLSIDELDNNDICSNDKNKLKSYKINNKIQEKLLPIMLLMKIQMENNI